MEHFTTEHEYVRVEGDVATIGITNYAQEQLGDVVFVELPEVGKTLATGDEAAVVESVKAASEILAPISGEVVEINQTIVDNPASVNDDPQGNAWFIKIKIADASELEQFMDTDAYTKFVEDLG